MDAIRVAELARQQSLDISDWLEITDIHIGSHGEYSIGADGVHFHPNADSAESGWSAEQIAEALPHGLRERKSEAQKKMLADNTSLLLFPCTPKQLVEFVLTRDVSGDLHGALPGPFIAAVYARDSQQQCVSAPKEASHGHLLAVAGLLELLLDDSRPRYTQGSIAEEIKARHPDWRGASDSSLTKLFAEARAAAKDADSEALSKDEARKAAVARGNARKTAKT